MTIIWIIIFILPPAGVSAVTMVTGHRGHSIQIRCPYESGYETYMKYLCRGTCSTLPWSTKDIPVQSGSTAEDQRFSLDDDTAARVFTITITDLRPEDGGTYWCGIQRSNLLPDIYTEVLLQVTLGFIVLFVSLGVSGIAAGVLVLFCKQKTSRDVQSSVKAQTDARSELNDYEKAAPKNQPSMVESPVYKNPTTTISQSDSVYQILNTDINQLDSVYQTLNPNTIQADTVYQSLTLMPTYQIQSTTL
ncbi:hypothetical protein NFI96_028642 [Prochilodus magdalenae]|nr:hypothetical protein NFI96_028642 [Prochilodus magdalenae]